MENMKEVLEDERKLEIEKLREEIEALDNQLFRLLEKRLIVSLSIGELKTESGDDVYDPEREKEIIENLISNDYDLPDDLVRRVMKTILTNMRNISQNENG